ncbi:hypothetical protein [Psychrobacillus sp. MER TA 171]|uniref:WapI family immunity protein n=1 Tax=Psychrobacillus sp. MER TA 171 TaxID=2939577 RepID=UPI0020413BD2|nr:hypothetical protein [Psychrobacillus sp. MER TA 171]MCM3359791.1 hypothetical protein [Psychrobacillus sp. MER TA 171]
MKFHLLGEKTKVEIDVLTREYPNSSSYWDVNWVISNVKVEIPGYYVNFTASLRTDEIRDFVNELKSMNRYLTGKAILKNLDSFIHFEGEMDKLGHIDWSGETCYPAGSGAVLSFEFVSDQSHLINLIKELENIIYVFPVIG